MVNVPNRPISKCSDFRRIESTMLDAIELEQEEAHLNHPSSPPASLDRRKFRARLAAYLRTIGNDC